MFEASKYTIGWVCALPIELTAARLHLDVEHDSSDYRPAPNDNSTYVFGSIGGHGVVIATLPDGEYGISSATGVATHMLRSFTDIKIGLMVGIGGGAPLVSEKRNQDIRLGDVVVSRAENGRGGVCQYDYGKAIQGEGYLLTGNLYPPPLSLRGAVAVLRSDFEINGNNIDDDVRRVLAERPRLSNKYQRPPKETDVLYKSDYIHSDSNESCSGICDRKEAVQRRDRDGEAVEIHYGLVGSANTLMKDAQVRDRLAQDLGLLCFEMEAAGLMNHLPFLVVRGICDYSDSHKNKEWQKYAAMTAASYTRKLLDRLTPSKVAAETGLKELKQIQDDLENVRNTVTKLDTDNLRKKLEAWLSAPNPRTNFLEALRLREPGTGLWLLDSTVYQQWKVGKIRKLWLCGKAGCGKSVLSAIINEDIQRYCADTDFGCAMFYFTFSDLQKQSYTDCLRALAQQVASREETLAALEELHQDHPDDSIGLEHNLQKILSDAILGYGRFYLVLDALDESPEVSKSRTGIRIRPREKLLRWLQKLVTEHPMLQVLATSRDLVDIREQLIAMDFVCQYISAEILKPDIEKFVNSQLNIDRRLSKLDAAARENIMNKLTQKTDGMFRWTYCQMNSLKDLRTTQPSVLDQVLNDLPSDLDETYERILRDVPPAIHDKVFAMLMWMSGSFRPLTIAEVSEARIINPGKSEHQVDYADRGYPEDILEMLSGLVILSEIEAETEVSQGFPDDRFLGSNYSQTIRLAHSSVQDYLKSVRILNSCVGHFHFEEISAQQYLCDCSLLYLMNYSQSRIKTKTEKDLALFPLLAYVVKYWPQHCQDEGDATRVVEFLERQDFLDHWLFVYNDEISDSLFHGVPSTLAEAVDGVYCASRFGWNNVLGKLIENGASVNSRGGFHLHAITVACAEAQDLVVATLVKAGADINIIDRWDYTPLATVLHYLKRLEDFQAFSRSSFQSSEHFEEYRLDIISRYERIVRLLVDAGVNLDEPNTVHGTHLQGACRTGDHSIVRLLLNAGATVDVENSLNPTPLKIAIMERHEQIVETLIQAGADVNQVSSIIVGWQEEDYFEDNFTNPDYPFSHRTPLFLACAGGNQAIGKMLIEAGANVDRTTSKFASCLKVAIKGWHHSIAETLVAAAAGAGPDRVEESLTGGRLG